MCTAMLWCVAFNYQWFRATSTAKDCFKYFKYPLHTNSFCRETIVNVCCCGDFALQDNCYLSNFWHKCFEDE